MKTSKMQLKKKEQRRFINGWEENKHVYELKKNDAITILKARLNMLNLKDNFHGKYKDNKCDLQLRGRLNRASI